MGGYTGVVTASNLLSALLTVDGHGTGLDADTLDGYHYTSFAPASGSGNYIQNQNSGAQNASMWISGGARFDGLTKIYQNLRFPLNQSGIWFTDTGFTHGIYNNRSNLEYISPGNHIFNSTIQATQAKFTTGAAANTIFTGDVTGLGSWSTINQAIGNNLMQSGCVQYFDGSKLGNTTIYRYDDSTVRQLGKFWVNPQSLSTSDYIFDVIGYAGGANNILRIGQSGYSNGFTVGYNGSNMEYIFEDGSVKIKNLSGTGTRLVGAANDGTLTTVTQGSGSGLNADLLDGQHGSYYQPVSTAITTGNIASQSVNYATSAGSVTNSITFNNSGSGDASGTTYNGNTARTISYNTLGAQPTLESGINIKTLNNGSLLGSGNITIDSGSVSVTQSGHGFSVGNVIKVSGANTFDKAQANSVVSAEVIGYVTEVTDVNNFKYVTSGYVSAGVPVATAGTVFYLDPTIAGALTSTEPTTVGHISKPVLIVVESGSKAVFVNFRGMELTSTASSVIGEIWTPITGTYASTTTFTFTGNDKDAKLIQLSLLTCTDSAGTTRRIGYIKSAVNNSGTITATVVTNSDLASGDKDFKVTYNRKVNDYLHLISIPGECTADTSYSQGVWLQDVQVDSYLLPVDFSVLTAAAGTGAALTVNIYKNTTNLFSSAPDMTTNTVLRSQRPTTNTISAGDNVSLRIMSSAGATNKAADFQAKLFVIPQNIFTAF